jgi:hypothetical protein
MDTALPERPKPLPPLRRWQFGLRHILAATTGVAAVLGLAAWGGWLHSDAVEYLLIAVVAGVFSPTARRVLLGGCVILGVFWLAMTLGASLFGVQGRGVDPRFRWIFAGLLTVSATLLRRYTKAGAFSLAASLLVIEVFMAVVIVYTYGCPTLFEAFGNEHRASAIQHLQSHFPTVEQWWIVTPWAAGIVFGAFWARHTKKGDRQEPRL